MKIARLDTLSRLDSLFIGGEPDYHYEKRQLLLVDDNYNFTANNATDITSIESINKWGLDVCKDELGVHFLMKDFFYTNKTWVTCSNIEKDIVIDNSFYVNFFDPNADINKITYLMNIHGMTQPEAIDKLVDEYATVQVKLSKAAEERATGKGLMKIVGTYLSNDDALDLIDTVRILMFNYKEFALIGTLYSDSGQEGIDDYINSRVGTAYEFSGLSSKGYTINPPYTEQNLIDDLSDYLIKKY